MSTETNTETCTCDHLHGLGNVVGAWTHDGDCPRYEPNLLSGTEVKEIAGEEWTNASTIKDLCHTLQIEREIHIRRQAMLDKAWDVLQMLVEQEPVALMGTLPNGDPLDGQCIHCDVEFEWNTEEDPWPDDKHEEHCVWRQAVELLEEAL